MEYFHMHADLGAEHSCLYCLYYLEPVSVRLRGFVRAVEIQHEASYKLNVLILVALALVFGLTNRHASTM